MTTRIKQLEVQRITLQLRSALQRQQIANQSIGIESRLAGADRIANVVTGIAKNPLILLGIVAGTMIIGPWRLTRWVSQGAMLFSVARKIQQLFAR